jgi:hypothetical protein
VAKTNSNSWLTGRHQLQAIERWYKHGWTRLDNRLRSSITEGVVVCLPLFDDNPLVHDTFCPPRSAYAGDVKPDDRTPLSPLDDLLESVTVLALNFPVVMNMSKGIGGRSRRRSILENLQIEQGGPCKAGRSGASGTHSLGAEDPPVTRTGISPRTSPRGLHVPASPRAIRPLASGKMSPTRR